MPSRDLAGDITKGYTRRQTLRTAAAAIVAFGAGGAAAAGTGPTEITGRTTIEEPGSYELGADVAIDGHGIRIEADDVVLDGNGHTIGGFHGVGVVVQDAADVALDDLRLELTDSPLLFDQADGCQLADSTIVDGEAPVVLRDSTDVRLAGNTIAELLGGGVLVEGGSDHRFEHNEIRENVGDGIWLRSTTHAVVDGNTITGNWNGINVGRDSSHNVIANNTTAENDRGIRVAGSDTELADNDSPDGIEVVEEDSNDEPSGTEPHDADSDVDEPTGC